MKLKQRIYLAQLIKAAFLLVNTNLTKKNELNDCEENLLKAVNECTKCDVKEEIVTSIGRELTIYEGVGCIGSYDYPDIFTNNNLMKFGELFTLNGQKYTIVDIHLHANRSVELKVNRVGNF
ncbi:hypothetical protein [Paenibacillus macquariensis]|uniref:Uncharacterized protein n=1 Tax=Paenibacillus macquariensis TaxID=948756 RepID=A0ABY1KEJ0_9BACL|nr:hypothetical protein [Paenibacillus macquariensis]OAB28412.1 hypothetical protein PMSM_24460 [Paenibacillus macquariensis subsp. macquariensis]SIR71630.1 hypothetical protein SAMN05421578_14213 [Paenibacillus macquariensis]